MSKLIKYTFNNRTYNTTKDLAPYVEKILKIKGNMQILVEPPSNMKCSNGKTISYLRYEAPSRTHVIKIYDKAVSQKIKIVNAKTPDQIKKTLETLI